MVVVADSAAAAEPLEVLRPDELVGEAASAVEAASAGVPVDTKVVDAPRVTAVKEAGAAPADPPAPAQDPTETQEEEQDATADGESPRPQAPAARENGGSSAGEGPSGRGGGGGGKSHSKIFVGGLTSQQDEASMKAFFEQFGKVSEVLVMRDVTTQRPRGFGFVTFESDAGFQSALATRFHVIDGKQVEVKPAVPRSEMAASESRQRWPNGSGPAGGGGRGSGKQRSSRDKSSHQGAQKLMHAGVVGTNPQMLNGHSTGAAVASLQAQFALMQAAAASGMYNPGAMPQGGSAAGFYPPGAYDNTYEQHAAMAAMYPPQMPSHTPHPQAHPGFIPPQSQAMPAQSQAMPAGSHGWTMHYAGPQGPVYYFHALTGMWTWERPQELTAGE